MSTKENCPALVTCQWLQDKLTSATDDVIVLDTTFNEKGPAVEDYVKGHIPSARYIDMMTISRPTEYIPHDLPDVKHFQDTLRSLGVNNSSHIVLYETAKMWPFAGPRLWWLIRAFGHDKVSVLNGGFPKWTSDGLPVSTDPPPTKTGDITLSINKNLMVTYDELKEIRSKGDYQIVDTRPSENYTGQEQEPSTLFQMILPAVGVKDWAERHYHTGAIPGAKNVPYPLLYDTDLISMRPLDQVKQLFSWAGADLTKPLLTSCYVGYTACMVALAAHICGNTTVPVYYGSWSEYGQRADVNDVKAGTAPSSPPPVPLNLPGAQL